jgi:cytochrome c oxidase cbb3-type subunit 2
MPQSSQLRSGWRGIGLITVTYVYFLIFAQFAFLKRLADLGVAGTHLKAVMAAMAVGGILASLLTPRLPLRISPALRLRLALLGCASAAALTQLPLTLAAAIAIAALIGSSLGLLTVTLVTHLRLWIGDRNDLMKIGLGTGLGYLLCNLAPLFTASPQIQAIAAATICLIGVSLTLQRSPTAPHPAAANDETKAAATPLSFPRVLACFTALVWLDSAAFFIIQNTPALKAGTWAGTLHLSLNGILHLLAALASAWLLRRRGLATVLSLAFLALAAACLLLLDPSRAVLASVFYPIGVSLYSVALVAYPSLLAPAASPAERARQAGWIYAVAGWLGSALGIGMGQNLGHIPPAFVLIAGLLILAPQLLPTLRQRRREALATLAVLAAAFALDRIPDHALPTAHPTAPERGRHVYIDEGCIQCHSQYVRPNTADVLLWGPTQSVAQLHRERPPLIGNRRQGPDLSEVGTRRSPLWLKAHLIDPAEVSHASFMPSYAYLFRDTRGADLVAYLQSLQPLQTPDKQEQQATSAHQRAEASWRPSPAAIAAANPAEGAPLFAAHCATCHAPTGRTRQRWSASFQRLPPDLTTGPFLHLSTTGSPADRILRLARITKFGLPGTDMPGHEYLPDRDIASLTLWLNQTMPQRDPNPQPSIPNGEQP